VLQHLGNANADDKCLVIPKLVAADVDLAALINPDAPQRVRIENRLAFDYLYRELWHKNVVYELPRFDADLEILKEKSFSFNEKSIDLIEQSFTTALEFLHGKGITHNDISPKNSLLKGERPAFIFALTDLGQATVNDDPSHEAKCEKDWQRLRWMINSFRELLVKKHRGIGDKKTFYKKNLPAYEKIRKKPKSEQPKIEQPEMIKPEVTQVVTTRLPPLTFKRCI